MLDALTAADFTALIGTTLPAQARLGDEIVDVPLTLVAVDERAPYTPELRAPFVLDLDGPAEPVLGQGIYAIEHPAHGPLELFLVPHAVGPSGARYSITVS